MKYLAAAAGLALSAIALASNAATAPRAIGTVDGFCDRKDAFRDPGAVAHRIVSCLIDEASKLDLDAPHVADAFPKAYRYEIAPELLADWQAHPRHAFGIDDGYVPVRMDNVQFDYTPSPEDGGPVFAHLGVWHIEGDWVSANGDKTRTRHLRLTISGRVLNNADWTE